MNERAAETPQSQDTITCPVPCRWLRSGQSGRNCLHDLDLELPDPLFAHMHLHADFLHLVGTVLIQPVVQAAVLSLPRAPVLRTVSSTVPQRCRRSPGSAPTRSGPQPRLQFSPGFSAWVTSSCLNHGISALEIPQISPAEQVKIAGSQRPQMRH